MWLGAFPLSPLCSITISQDTCHLRVVPWTCHSLMGWNHLMGSFINHSYPGSVGWFWNHNFLFIDSQKVVKVYLSHLSVPEPTFIFFCQETTFVDSLIQTVYVIGVWVLVVTNLLDFSLLISHFFESKSSVCPWSHICLTLNRLWFMLYMRSLSFAVVALLQSLIVRVPITFADPSFPKDIVPSLSFFQRYEFGFVSGHMCWATTINIPHILLALSFYGKSLSFLLLDPWRSILILLWFSWGSG